MMMWDYRLKRMFPCLACCLLPAPLPAQSVVASLTASHTAKRTGKPARDERVGLNLLHNADFASGLENWTLEGHMGAGVATMRLFDATSELKGVSGKIAQFDIREVSRQNWHVQFYQDGVDFADGQRYTVTFWAKADHPRPLTVQASVADWHGIGLAAENLALTTEWQRFMLTFTAMRTVQKQNRLTFLLGDELGTVSLAGIAVQLGMEAEQSQLVRPTLIGVWDYRDQNRAKSYRLTFNADGTGSLHSTPASMSANALPHAPVSNPFRWYVSEKDKSLCIGPRRYTWCLRSIGQSLRLTLRDQNGKVHTLSHYR